MILLYNLAILVILMIIFIYLSGWFSSTETSLTHLNNAQVAEMKTSGEKNIEYIIKLKKDMDRTLIVILVGNNVVNITLSSVAALIANAIFQTLGVSVIIGLITFFLIIFGEITPKAGALFNCKKIASKNAKKIYLLMRIFSPMITLFILISRNIIKLTGGNYKTSKLLVSDNSIMGLATLGEEEGVIKKIEREIIHHVFRFGDKKAKDIMVLIDSVFCLKLNYTIKEARMIVVSRGFTRVPIVNEEKKIIGILYSKDLLGKKDGPIESLLREPFKVKITDDITDIFNLMKKMRVHIAIVENNNGEDVGIITLEDILEELVGEIYDEYTMVQEGSNNVNV